MTQCVRRMISTARHRGLRDPGRVSASRRLAAVLPPVGPAAPAIRSSAVAPDIPPHGALASASRHSGRRAYSCDWAPGPAADAAPRARGEFLHSSSSHGHLCRRLEALADRYRWHVRSTLTAASWLNQVERFFALLTARQLGRGVHRSAQELKGHPPLYGHGQRQPATFPLGRFHRHLTHLSVDA